MACSSAATFSAPRMRMARGTLYAVIPGVARSSSQSSSCAYDIGATSPVARRGMSKSLCSVTVLAPSCLCALACTRQSFHRRILDQQSQRQTHAEGLADLSEHADGEQRV